MVDDVCSRDRFFFDLDGDMGEVDDFAARARGDISNRGMLVYERGEVTNVSKRFRLMIELNVNEKVINNNKRWPLDCLLPLEWVFALMKFSRISTKKIF